MNMTEPTQFIAGDLRGTLHRDVDMRRHTSWRAGGRVQRMYQPADLADLVIFLRTLPAEEPLITIGLGSNLLVRDGGLRGTVLLLHGALDELRMEEEGLVHAQAGVPGAKLARFAALHNLGGAEFFAGIPGTVGGMLAMNAGCHGSETWDFVERVQVITRNGDVLERTAQDYDIGYRHVERNADCGLHPQGVGRAVPVAEATTATLRIADYEKTASTPHSALSTPHSPEFFVGAWFKFAAGDGEISRETIKALLNKRSASQPSNLPNAGSVFRNPPGDYAARLIEQCGLKGRQIGGARVSEKHANFIVNVGEATAGNIENLIDEVQAVVEQQTGVRLQCEVRIMGEAT